MKKNNPLHKILATKLDVMPNFLPFFFSFFLFSLHSFFFSFFSRKVCHPYAPPPTLQGKKVPLCPPSYRPMHIARWYRFCLVSSLLALTGLRHILCEVSQCKYSLILVNPFPIRLCLSNKFGEGGIPPPPPPLPYA